MIKFAVKVVRTNEDSGICGVDFSGGSRAGCKWLPIKTVRMSGFPKELPEP